MQKEIHVEKRIEFNDLSVNVRCELKSLKHSNLPLAKCYDACKYPLKMSNQGIVSSMAAAEWIAKNPNNFARIWAEL